VEGDDTSTRLWADCFKDMAAAAYNKWCSFIKEHLPEGNHRETMGLGGAGELGDPDEEMKKHMRNVKGNVLAESVFGVGDRLISTVTNAGLATVAALAAAKMTQPMQWLDLRSTPALDALIFEFCNHQSTVRGREEIARTAAQVAARYKEKQTIKARSKEKAKAVYREHAILKALVDKGEFAANVPAMSKRLKEIGGNDTLTAAAKIVAQMKYLKLQRSFLEHVWVRKKLLPVLQAPLVAGAKRRKAWTPEQFAQKLGVVLASFRENRLKADYGEEDGELLPVLPLDKKLEALKAFRGASPTKRCEELREKQIKQYDAILEELKEELKADAKALMEKLTAVRASQRARKKGKNPLELKAAKPPALKKKQDVWVVDTAGGGGNPEQRQDAEGTEVMIWPGKMQYKLNRQQISAMDADEDIKAEWYSISFDDCEACNYPRASIFVSFAEATVNLYIG